MRTISVPGTLRKRSDSSSDKRVAMLRSLKPCAVCTSATGDKATLRVKDVAPRCVSKLGSPAPCGNFFAASDKRSRISEKICSLVLLSTQSCSSILTTDMPAREVDFNSLISSSCRNSSSITSLTKASTRSAEAPGKGVSAITFLKSIRGSSKRGKFTTADRPATMTMTILNSNRCPLRKNKLYQGIFLTEELGADIIYSRTSQTSYGLRFG